MRIFNSEFAHAHDLLTFAYATYCIQEKDDALEAIYENGFLPYSGSPAAENMFYMARSTRLPLRSFVPDSECRRITAKFDNTFLCNSQHIDTFTITEEFIDFWLTYYETVHGPNVMPRERLEYILHSKQLTHITTYTDTITNEPVAHTFEVRNGVMSHVWYTSYAVKLIKKSFGMWLLLDSARRAKEEGKQYFYLGTAYGNKTSYKTNFPHLEYWDGTTWMGDSKNKLLRERARTDSNREFHQLDQWKEQHDLFLIKPLAP